RRGAGAIAPALEPVVEAARDVVAEGVAARHGLGLRLGKFHELGIEGDRREPVVGAVAGDHGGGHRRVDLRVLGREALIEAWVRRQIALAGAGAQERRYRNRGEARAKAHPWAVKSHPGPPSPKQSLCGNSMAEAWRPRWLAPVNFSLPARTCGAGALG